MNMEPESSLEDSFQNPIDEKFMWEGTPSQWINFSFYFLCIPLVFVFGLGIILMVWKYLDTSSKVYKISNERITYKRGIFSTVTDEIELFRVKDITFQEPFFLRIFKLSNIILKSSDATHPVLSITGVKDGKKIKELLRKVVENRRKIKNVREFDFN